MPHPPLPLERYMTYIATSTNTLKINATTTINTTMQTASTTNASSTYTICAATDTIITADRQYVGRYFHDKTGTTGYFKIASSTNNNCSGGTDQFVVIAEPDTNLSALAVGDTFNITDFINKNDQFEILDYAQVTAATNTNGYIWAKAGSETLIRYADISEMGTCTAYRQTGVSFYYVNGSNANEGFTIQKSRIHNSGNYGMFLSYSTNNTDTKGFSNNAVYENYNSGLYFDYSSNNTFSFNNIYGNLGTSQSAAVFFFRGSNNNFNSNNIYGNTAIGLMLDYGSNNTVTSNNSYGNTSYGFRAQTPPTTTP